MERLEEWKCSETYKEVANIFASHIATMFRNPDDLPPIEIYKPTADGIIIKEESK